MISRLMLNLRDPKLYSNVRSVEVRSAVSRIVFELGRDSVVGGQTLDGSEISEEEII